MLCAVAAVVIIIQNVCWWSWAHLRCIWKLLNLTQWLVSVCTNTAEWKYIKIQITRWEKN